MYALLHNGQVTKVGELSILFPTTSNPTAAFAAAHGALEVVEGEQKDQRFYWVTFDKYTVKGNVVERTYINTPKNLDDVIEVPVGQTEAVTTKGLKSNWISFNKSKANNLLANTDWVVTRKAERNIPIPEDIAAERAQIIADCTAKEIAILACTTVDELIAIVNS